MMYKVDHIMIETKTPLETAKKIANELNLPLAWELIENNDYKSIGINFGDINFEFIDFKRRFGIEGKSYKGFSGIAFRIDGEIEDTIENLKNQNFKYRIAEETDSYTTITIEEDTVFPTMFLVKYHFDITPWHSRLQEEFKNCDGGKYKIDKFISINMNKSHSNEVLDKFKKIETNEQKNSVAFTIKSHISEPIILSDLIENLEIILF